MSIKLSNFNKKKSEMVTLSNVVYNFRNVRILKGSFRGIRNHSTHLVAIGTPKRNDRSVFKVTEKTKEKNIGNYKIHTL